MESRLEMSEVGLSGEAGASMSLFTFHAMGSEVVRRWATSQSVLARYKRLSIERDM
jgi:hypothetical protein